MFNSSNLSVGVDGFAVVPHASTNFPARARGLYVGVGGDIVLITPKNTVLTFVGVPQGSVLPVECIRVNAVGTSASSLVGIV